MFTKLTSNISNCLQQTAHGLRLPQPVFVSRSSLVAYSLVYRRPNEDRTRNKQKTNERATNVGRETNEKLSKTRRGTALLDGKGSFLVSNVKPNKLNRITFVLTGRG